MRILVAEDDERIAEGLKTVLTEAGYAVDVAKNGDDAWFLGGTEDYDAILLDLGLPGIDGLSVLKRWRQEGCMVPVLVLTARSSWMERVEGINAGADDYLPKPFQMEEVLARLRAIIRRSTGRSSSVLEVGSVRLDDNQMRVTVQGSSVNLTPLEFRLLSYLMHHQNRVISQGELTEHVYAQDYERDANAIEALVSRIRRKLGADIIETRRGFGYVIVANETDNSLKDNL